MNQLKYIISAQKHGWEYIGLASKKRKRLFRCTCGCQETKEIDIEKLSRYLNIKDNGRAFLCKKRLNDVVFNHWNKYLPTYVTLVDANNAKWLYYRCNSCNKVHKISKSTVIKKQIPTCFCKKESIVGRKIGEWTVLKQDGAYHFCQCSCGTIRKLETYSLKNNKTKSCGCKLRENLYKACVDKYGTPFPAQTKEIKKKIKEKLIKNNIIHTMSDGSVLYDKIKQYNVNISNARRIFKEQGEKSLLRWLQREKKSTSSLETHFIQLLKDNNIKDIVYYNKKLESLHYKPDFASKSGSLYIDVDGLKWHSYFESPNLEANIKDCGAHSPKNFKYYHFKKREKYEQSGLTLFQFRQDEVIFKPNIVLSIINSKLNKNKKIFARKLNVGPVNKETAFSFFNENHLMGPHNSSKAIGLFTKEGELVCSISYKKYKNGIDISRFATKIGITVVGGLGKLISHIEKTESPVFIQSYVDLRYGTGKSLKTLGFSKESITLGWKWTDNFCTFNRLYCKAGNGKTEKENAKDLNLKKIYDAGQAKFVKYFSKI